MLNYYEIKQRIIQMIEEMTDHLPPMVRTIVTMNIGSVKQLVINMSDAEIDTLLLKIENIIEVVKYGNTDSEHDTK